MKADEITRTARQVLVPGARQIHQVSRTTLDHADGRTYRTRCRQTLSVGVHRAFLTTRDATCYDCARASVARNPVLEALP